MILVIDGITDPMRDSSQARLDHFWEPLETHLPDIPFWYATPNWFNNNVPSIQLLSNGWLATGNNEYPRLVIIHTSDWDFCCHDWNQWQNSPWQNSTVWLISGGGVTPDENLGNGRIRPHNIAGRLWCYRRPLNGNWNEHLEQFVPNIRRCYGAN